MVEQATKRGDDSATLNASQRPNKRARMSTENSNADTEIPDVKHASELAISTEMDDGEDDTVYQPEEIRASDLYLDTASSLDIVIAFVALIVQC